MAIVTEVELVIWALLLIRTEVMTGETVSRTKVQMGESWFSLPASSRE